MNGRGLDDIMEDSLFLLIIFSPLLLVLFLANLADKKREEPRPIFAILTYLTLGSFWGMLFLAGALSMLAGIAFSAIPEMTAGNPAAVELFPPETFIQLGLALWLPALIGMFLLLPFVRRLFARFTNTDSARTVHAVALSLIMLIIANLWATLAIGLDNIAEMMAAGPELTTTDVVSTTWVQDVLMALMAIVGVGWLVRRAWGASLKRLGLVLPTWRQVVFGIGLAGVLIVALILMEYLLSFTSFEWDQNVEKVSEQIIGPLMMTIPGILTLGLAAALGEELIFRGALQPRFGLLLTAALFALLHSTYGITLSTLVVFMLGLVLGWQRIRYNTSTAMITHATYNITLGLIAFLNLWPEW